MIRRKIEREIEAWHRAQINEALLIDGARQVGKTFIIREFGKRHFENVVELNFLKDKTLTGIFNGVANASEVLMRISALPKVKLIPRKTLIFFDEVQECPEVVTYIKFLVDEGGYRYILSGSLLGVELKDLRSAPVGYLRELTMYPIDFEEFSRAVGVNDDVVSHLRKCWIDRRPVDPVVHERMKAVFRLYLVVGGMPAAVQKYLDTENIAEVVKEQKGILVEYRRDATKYAKRIKLNILQVLDLLPEELNRKNKRFLVADVEKGGRYDRMQDGFLWLAEAGIGLPCTAVSEPRVPLRLSQKSSFFKLYMNDVGLLSAMYMEGLQFRILSGETSINNGAIYENFVAQELAAHGFPLHYCMGENIGEIDFIIQYNGKVLPIEAKSGRRYRTHAALDNLLGNESYGLDSAIVLSDYNSSSSSGILYFPVYLVTFLEHDQLPEDAVFRLPSIGDLKVNPHFQ
jgi:predicted AAA+ superfamily ATPase